MALQLRTGLCPDALLCCVDITWFLDLNADGFHAFLVLIVAVYRALFIKTIAARDHADLKTD
jgi:hypothetical protein